MNIAPIPEERNCDPPLRPLIASLWRLGLAGERTGRARPGSLLREANHVSRALLNPASARQWFRFLETFACCNDLPAARREVAMKPFGNYAVNGLAVAERVALLRWHYLTAAQLLPRTLLASLWTYAGVELGQVTGKSGRIYRLSLDAPVHCSKEGEYTLTFADATDGLILAQLTFIFACLDAPTPEKILLIGGLQGPSSFHGPIAKGRVVKATRDLAGLRPKMAVFVAASALAAAAGATDLRAVSNATHTINADASYQRKRLHADYDAFWLERQGVPDSLGFRLPLDHGPKANRAARNDKRAQVAALIERLFAAEAPSIYAGPAHCRFDMAAVSQPPVEMPERRVLLSGA
jgi:uncharacterized protein VirK/YbjX